MKNNFDNIEIDFESIKKKIQDFDSKKKTSIIPNIFKKYFVGFLIYTGIYKKLVNSSFIYKWFIEFEFFWRNFIGGRPLYFHDFHFLLGIYRQKFQLAKVEDNPSSDSFLKAWQNNQNLYLLFGAVRKYALEPFSFYRIEKYIKNGDNFLEYGCGIAPITYSLINFSSKKINYFYADIMQINTLYANYRLKDKADFIELHPTQYNLKLKKKLNVITLITVLEHLTDPIECLNFLHSNLTEGGYLIFDYIKSEGTGLDTVEALNERKGVLQFIKKNYELISGELSLDKSMGLTVVKKK